MRISDWSSDVCSSDLPAQAAGPVGQEAQSEECRDHRETEHTANDLRQARARQRLRIGAIGPHQRLARLERAAGGVERVSGVHAGRSAAERSVEHTSELQSLMSISYAVFCL